MIIVETCMSEVGEKGPFMVINLKNGSLFAAFYVLTWEFKKKDIPGCYKSLIVYHCLFMKFSILNIKIENGRFCELLTCTLWIGWWWKDDKLLWDRGPIWQTQSLSCSSWNINYFLSIGLLLYSLSQEQKTKNKQTQTNKQTNTTNKQTKQKQLVINLSTLIWARQDQFHVLM